MIAGKALARKINVRAAMRLAVNDKICTRSECSSKMFESWKLQRIETTIPTWSNRDVKDVLDNVGKVNEIKGMLAIYLYGVP